MKFEEISYELGLYTMSYDELILSNWGFIDAESQTKLRAARILLAGCGLGSNLALLAARTGFTNFILADGDVVKLGNLNRQAFRREHLGRNKAEVTAELIKEINPQVEIEIFPQYISTETEVSNLVLKSDIIVNMVDPGRVLFQLHDIAIKQDKPILFPLNLGYGGLVLVFTKKSIPLEQIASPDTNPEDYFIKLALKMAPFLPQYLQQFIGLSKKAEDTNLPLPQLGIAANISSALTVTAMVKLTIGVPVALAPIPLCVDGWQPAKYNSVLGELDA
jgi:molybdopterin/thiamine biosynthesis adenylyltransferase